MKEALELFNNYYEQFEHGQWGVYMKYDHTMRVVDYAKRIANSLNLSDDDIDLACRCALFHDISRFKQWSEYKTFEDSISFDHGDEGYNILKELGVDDEIILLSTKYHNKYAVPDNVDYRTKIFCNITRDADKIDILLELDNKFTEEELSLPSDIMEPFKEHKMVKNSPKYWNSQGYIMLRYLGFIFDMNYKEAFKIIKDTDIVNIKCNTILDKIDDERIKEIKDICNKYIDERISD